MTHVQDEAPVRCLNLLAALRATLGAAHRVSGTGRPPRRHRRVGCHVVRRHQLPERAGAVLFAVGQGHVRRRAASALDAGVPQSAARPDGIDFVIVRENLEDLYVSLEGDLEALRPLGLTSPMARRPAADMGPGQFALKVITEAGSELYADYPPARPPSSRPAPATLSPTSPSAGAGALGKPNAKRWPKTPKSLPSRVSLSHATTKVPAAPQHSAGTP